MKSKNTNMQNDREGKFVNTIKPNAGNLGMIVIEMIVLLSTSSILIGLLIPAVQR